MTKLVSKLKSVSGQGLVEYALILGLIAVVVIVALTFMGPRIASVFNNISGQIK